MYVEHFRQNLGADIDIRDGGFIYLPGIVLLAGWALLAGATSTCAYH